MTPISSVPVLQRKNHGHFNVDKILIINTFLDFFASFFIYPGSGSASDCGSGSRRENEYGSEFTVHVLQLGEHRFWISGDLGFLFRHIKTFDLLNIEKDQQIFNNAFLDLFFYKNIGLRIYKRRKVGFMSNAEVVRIRIRIILSDPTPAVLPVQVSWRWSAADSPAASPDYFAHAGKWKWWCSHFWLFSPPGPALKFRREKITPSPCIIKIKLY